MSPRCGAKSKCPERISQEESKAKNNPHDVPRTSCAHRAPRTKCAWGEVESQKNQENAQNASGKGPTHFVCGASSGGRGGKEDRERGGEEPKRNRRFVSFNTKNKNIFFETFYD